ncbi:MAG: hypothetical protein MUF15_17380 [Acidobacteria bacterium]|jgi:hypothetical protein|nr:hypothetical protein [Acidobacteriota bacterium]
MKWKSILIFFLSTIGEFIINSLLDAIHFLGFREKISSTNVNLYIDRPGSFWGLSIYYIILALIITILIFLFIRCTRNRSILKKVLIWLGGIILVISAFYIFLNFAIPIAQVDYKTEISGSVKDKESFTYLFVRPISTGQIWLQDPVPLQPDSFGKWRATTWFGGTSGEKYEIYVISSPSEIKGFSLSGAYDFKNIPRGTERFVRVVEHK